MINELKIANCRGKKPVINDIKKAYKIINALLIEINPCEGLELLKKADIALYQLIKDNQ